MNEQNNILFGEDKEENIVCIETSRNQNMAHIFKRVDGELESRYEPIEYLVYVPSDEPLLEKYDVDQHRLFGTNKYDVLVKTKDRSIYLDFKYNARDSFCPYEKSLYMIETGKTCFKGMNETDQLILFFDLETYTKEGYEFSNATREEDKIIMIAVRTNKGYEVVLRLDKHDSEEDLIKHFIHLVRKIDPDIIANHNIFNFDLKYLNERCKLHHIKLALGRDGSEPNIYDTEIKFADRSREYTNFDIYGRTVIDTQFLAEYADVTNRDMPSYRLKDLVKYLGKAQDDRVYIDGADIAPIWRGDHDISRDELAKYAIDDVREAEVLYNEYCGAYFRLTQMVPMNYQEVFRYGTGNQVEYVFLREYYRQNWSYPKNEEDGKVPGGYADVLNWGIFKGNICYIDVKSLYPSLAVMLEIQPEKDELKIFQKILDSLINIRYDIKRKIKKFKARDDKAGEQRQKSLDASIKIFLNTMAYGFIASPWNAFADYEEASRITLGGQKMAKEIIDIVRRDGGTPIKWDTDGGAVILPSEYQGDEERVNEYCRNITERLPEGIIVENDGMFDAIIPFDGKSYAMLEKDGNVKVKGNTLIGRSIEGFGTWLISNCVNALLKEDYETAKRKCKEYYETVKKDIETRSLKAEDVSKRASLNMTLESYKHKNTSGNTQTLAQYELALNANKDYSKGDVISYYIKEFPYVMETVYNKPVVRKKKCKNYEAAELISNYNYDYEVDYYLDRLDKTAKKFMALGPDIFNQLFNVKIYAKDKKRYKKITGKDWPSEQD